MALPDPSASPPMRAAATVLLLRDGAAGPEVFLIKRHENSNVHGGSYVFPGGKVDLADAQVDFAAHLDQPPDRLKQLLGEDSLDARAAAAIVFAALREVFEECGVLLAQGADAARVARAGLLARQGVGLTGILEALQLRLNTQAVLPWSRWITPLNSLNSPGKRFDTRFFVAAAPADQQPRHDNHEAVQSIWLPPRVALEQYWRGDMAMVAPQLMSLAHLTRHRSVASILDEARSRPPCLVQPHPFVFDNGRAIAYPGDELHPVPHRAMPGPLRLVQRGKRLEPPEGFEGFFDLPQN